MAILEYSKQNHIVIIQMNRPERLNAIDYQLKSALAEAWYKFEQDDDAWIGIITGFGKGFCVGLDVKDSMKDGKLMANFPPTSLVDLYWEDLFEKPVIAAVNGFAYGGGVLLAGRADLRIASNTAKFQISETVLGFPVGFYPTRLWIMRENLPYAITAELLAGMSITAQRAYQIGYVNKVVEPDKLMDEAIKMAESLINIPPLAACQNLKLLRNKRRFDARAYAYLDVETGRQYWESRGSADSAEAVNAFLEKRKPVFTRK